MVMEKMIVGTLEVFSIAVRALSVAIAVLLVGRSLIDKTALNVAGEPLKRFIRLTDIVVVPVKRMLPPVIAGRRTDYSPLVSALALLFIGLGVSAFLEMVASGIVG